ncbi:MAG TPA: HD domain-containing protein, partial [Candidatus Methylacidiphilales bacterium]|nr:HD domain-containing protein [Candidatus Methylacidiphilales bacterium]
ADLLRGDAAGNPKGDDIYKERTSEIAIKAYADAWPDLIALCPPRTAECVSVSLNAVKRWLRVQWGKTFYENAKHRNGGSQPDNATTVDDATDVEVTPASGDDDADNRSPTHPCLVWRGRKRSRLIGPAEADDIQPGDTVVLPVIDEDSLAGLAHSFLEAGNRQGLGAGIKDLYELSVLKSERPPMLRINRALWHDWVRTDARSVEAETAMPQLREARESVRALVDACCKDVDEPSPARAEIVDHIRQVVASWEALSPECESIAKALAERARPLPLPAVLPRWLVDLLRMFLDDSVATGHVDQVEVHPCGGIVVFAKQISSGEAEKREKEQDLFADEDDATSFSSKAVSLWDHTHAVIHSVDNFAKHCLPPELRQVVHDSALWHDVGKLDLRFQLILHNGDSRAVEAAHAKPLAKSNRIPLSKSRSAEIYGLAGLPKRFRHEMLSAQIAGKFGPLRADAIETALFLHLIASHHGYARPLAPISVDPPPQAVLADDPPAEVPGISTDRVVLPGIRFNFTEEERAGCLPLHHVASGVTDRFWTLTRHYGWWGLAYLEAIMRLGDWRGSYIPHEVTPSVSVESTVIPDSDRS